MMNFNDADSQFGDLIPAGTMVRVSMFIRPGGSGPGGILTPSKSSDAQMLDVELTVVNGQFSRRKIWQNMTVSGGKLNEKGESIAGNITRSTLRAILESARGIMPQDMSPEAQAKRSVQGYHDFNYMEFAIKVGVEKDKLGQYADKNKIQVVITPDKKEYQAVMAGQAVAPTAAPGGGAAPTWATGQQQQAPAAPAGGAPSWAAPNAPKHNVQPNEWAGHPTPSGQQAWAGQQAPAPSQPQVPPEVAAAQTAASATPTVPVPDWAK